MTESARPVIGKSESGADYASVTGCCAASGSCETCQDNFTKPGAKASGLGQHSNFFFIIHHPFFYIIFL